MKAKAIYQEHPEFSEQFQSLPSKPISKLRRVKNILYVTIFTVLCSMLSSCAGGYVATEPVYERGYDRPISPGGAYIWIEGDWMWNNRTHVYVHQPGYWARQRGNRSYREGYWQSGPKGKSWMKGHWERKNHHDDNDRRDHDHNR
jgi:hypothetical protein